MMNAGSQTTLIVILVGGIWLVGYILTTVVSKNALTLSKLSPSDPTAATAALKWVELSSLQHLVGFLISSVLVKVVGKSLWPPQVLDHKLVIFMAVVCNVMANLASNSALTIADSGLAHIIESFQPLFTYPLMFILSKGSDSLSISTFSSVAIISIGVSGLVGNMAASPWVFFTALVSSAGLALRNVLLKKPSEKWDSSLQKFMFVSLLSAILVFPLWLIKLAFTRTLSTDGLYALSSVTHSIYNLVSFNFLESMNTMTHAILTILIKALTFTGIADFSLMKTLNISFSWNFLFSILVVLIGIFCYNMEDTTTKRRSLPMFILISLTMFYLFVAPSQHFFHPNFSMLRRTCNKTIFTTWVYERLIPDPVVSNLVAMASQNPHLSVHVYCGSTQCENAILRADAVNLKVNFAVISDIVRETSLEPWLDRHPFNKMLAGKDFERHLEEVTILGVLWKYGGAYVNPMVILSEKLNFKGFDCQEPSAVVNDKDGTVLLYSPPNHPFTHDLAKRYVWMYPTTRDKSKSPHKKGLFRSVWTMALRKCSTTTCPAVMSGFSYSLLSSTSDSEEEASRTNHFGMFVYSSAERSPSVSDLDDEIQDFAGLYFLPYLDTFMDRDDMGNSISDNRVTAFFNGWGTTTASRENWQPPPSNVDPVTLSVHLQEGMKEKWIEQAAYLKKHSPVGCIDSSTLDFLQKHNVPAFFSGLMLLTKSPNKQKMHRHGVHIADVSNDLLKLLPKDIQRSVLRGRSPTTARSRDHLERFRGIYQLVENLQSAKLVITQCLHCALACVAMETPVIFVHASGATSPAAEMTSLFHTLDLHNRSKGEAREWLANFPWKDIPPNPDISLMMRLRATAWNVIRQNQALYDSARKFGIFPMSPSRILPNDRKILFHMIFTSSSKSVLSVLGSNAKQSGAFNWRHWRSVESIFRHHPTADLVIHSNTLSQSIFDVMTESGYSITVSPYDIEDLLTGSPAAKFLEQLDDAKHGTFWVYNEANLLRLLFLYFHGGLYMDTDIILVRPLDSLTKNAFGYQDQTLNNAIIMFDKGHPFLKLCLEQFVENYNGEIWAFNGPERISAAMEIWKETHDLNDEDPTQIHTWATDVFYMIHYRNIKEQCFKIDHNMKILHTKAYGVHINAKLTGDINKLKEGTFCSHLLNEYCVLCDHVF